ncbi:hypothetical protein Tco_1139386 [Tanacetum coccineum]
MQNIELERMILESVENSLLIWSTIEENDVTRTKKYVELSATKKIQADYDMKATNIILQGLLTNIYSLVNYHRVAKDLWERVQLLMQVNTKFLNSLPPEWSKFVTDVKLVKDLHTTNFDQLHAYLEQHELHANEVLLFSVFSPGEYDLIYLSQTKAMAFLTMVTVQQDLGRQGQSYSSTGYKSNAASSGRNNASGQLKKLDKFWMKNNWKKSYFMVKEGIVLGHKISKSGFEVDRAKVEVIAKLPHPTSVKGVRSFLGHAGFYRRFIQDFSKIARPMTHLLEKETPFVFSEECIKDAKARLMRWILFVGKYKSKGQSTAE